MNIILRNNVKGKLRALRAKLRAAKFLESRRYEGKTWVKGKRALRAAKNGECKKTSGVCRQYLQLSLCPLPFCTFAPSNN